jgi:transposase
MPTRQVFAAIVDVLRTGCQWKALTREFGSASAIRTHFQRWQKMGIFLRLCLATSTAAVAQTSAVDVCYSMAQNALHNITVSQTNDDAVAALYSNYRYADGSTNTGSINASGNAVVNGLPIGAGSPSRTRTVALHSSASNINPIRPCRTISTTTLTLFSPRDSIR